MRIKCCIAIFLLALNISAQAKLPIAVTEATGYPNNVYFGDTHLHTNLSFDSYIEGNTTMGPEEAYRFAKGESIVTSTGQRIKLDRPLDFLVVADHGNNMGVLKGLADGNSLLKDSHRGKNWLNLLNILEVSEKNTSIYKESRALLATDIYSKYSLPNEQFKMAAWSEVTSAADKHNTPDRFTAFIGYEWTAPFYRLHRVLIFKDDAKKAGQVVPFTQFDSFDPEDLWNYMEGYEKNTGGEVLAIPHNANLSQGVMFALEDARGRPFSKRYAQSRSRWEPLFEVVQNKGDSETHPSISPNDEFSDFKKIDTSNNYSYSEEIKKFRKLSEYGFEAWIKKNRKEFGPSWKYRYEYARPALKQGLSEAERLGVNPFKFGLIGSTDAHSSLSSIGDSGLNPTLAEVGARPATAEGVGVGPNMLGSGGYAAVWAKENSRESLFAAMKRKEVFATTGPRMKVRFFGGWDFKSTDSLRPDLANIGYSKGVPMGGDLVNGPKSEKPSFLIHAVRDPSGANLDRVQVVKGWLDAKGELHEKIFNVALSDNRQETEKGIIAVGNTVDLKEGAYLNSIGDPELAVVWKDKEFNSQERSFYYVRVLEIPTPVRVSYDVNPFYWKPNITKKTPMIVQERAYTSPIWYSPAM